MTERNYQRQFRLKKRDEIVARIVADFITSGIKYTCRQVVNDFSRDRIATALAALDPALIDAEPLAFSRRRLMTRIADAVHDDWKAKQP